MSDKVNILVTGAGGTTGQSVIKALRLSSLDCRVIGVDVNAMAAGLYRSDAGYLVSRADSMEYPERIIDICKKENVAMIMIGSTPEVPVLSRHKEEIEENSGALVLVSDLETVDICYNKYKTYQFLKENKLPNKAISHKLLFHYIYKRRQIFL